jgi:succinate-acetate transporter protein
MSTTRADVEKANAPNVLPGPSNQANVAQRNTAAAGHYTGIGDPTGLGLFSFASTLLILSLYNLQTRSITHPNVIVGMAIFCGGLAMILAGMWAFPRGDSFIGTVFILYGAYWLSYALLLIPGTGILSAYALDSELRSALGIYLVTWGLVTFFLLFASLRRNIAFSIFLLFLAITFWVLAGGVFHGTIRVIKAGGVLGCITAFIAYYCGLSHLFAADRRPLINMPLGSFEY